MKCRDYVAHLQTLADAAEKGTDQETADATQAVATFAGAVYQMFDGVSLAAVFFALPVLGEVIHSSVLQYQEAITKGDLVTTLSSQEREFLWNLKDNLLDAVSHIDELAPTTPVQNMSNAEVEAMFETLPDDGKSDA